jgi:hypothetical protein
VAKVFMPSEGGITVLPKSGSLPGSIKLVGSSLSSKVIFTGFGYAQSGHAQFQPSLRNALYVTSFGDKPGQIELSGMAFSYDATRNCNAPNRVSGSGAEELLDYYRDKRLAAKGEAVEVKVGAKPVRGFLMACRVENRDAKTMAYQFSLSLLTVPLSALDVEVPPDVKPPAPRPPAPAPSPPGNDADQRPQEAGDGPGNPYDGSGYA